MGYVLAALNDVGILGLCQFARSLSCYVNVCSRLECIVLRKFSHVLLYNGYETRLPL